MCLFLASLSILDMRLFRRKIFENIVAAFTFVSRLALLHCYRLTGRRTEKDGNLAIWSRREHKKRTSGRIKVVTMLDEISSFFVYLPPRHHISQYFPPFSVLHVSYSRALQIIRRRKWKRQLY